MAVSKKKKNDSAVEVEETIQEEVVVETPVEEVECEECKVEAPAEDTTPTVEVNEKTNETSFTVEVEKDNIDVKEEDAPKDTNPMVRIRMRVDHHCVIAMERYDLHAGKTYNVPSNVKEILNKNGFLAPL